MALPVRKIRENPLAQRAGLGTASRRDAVERVQPLLGSPAALLTAACQVKRIGGKVPCTQAAVSCTAPDLDPQWARELLSPGNKHNLTPWLLNSAFQLS